MRQDTPLKNAAIQLGKRYLSEGTSLLHGDYYPGSWLKTKTGLRIIDPEFCFFGPKEYDLGVLRAHLKMAEQPISYLIDFWKHYPESDVNSSLVDQFVQQANPEEPPQLVTIQGRVRQPGTYPILATNDF